MRARSMLLAVLATVPGGCVLSGSAGEMASVPLPPGQDSIVRNMEQVVDPGDM